jgi:hypothetical protein
LGWDQRRGAGSANEKVNQISVARSCQNPRFLLHFVQFPIADESTDFSAERRWLAYSRRFRDAVTDNVWCTRCRKAVRILRYTVHPKPGGIALVGTCAACGNQVFRYIGDNE